MLSSSTNDNIRNKKKSVCKGLVSIKADARDSCPCGFRSFCVLQIGTFVRFMFTACKRAIDVKTEFHTYTCRQTPVFCVLSSITNKMQCCTIFFIAVKLYMFQTVSPPIIRSSKLYTQHLIYVKLTC